MVFTPPQPASPRRHKSVFRRVSDGATVDANGQQVDVKTDTATALSNPAHTVKGATQSRKDLFFFAPEQLVVATDPAHPLFDERIRLPVNEGLVVSIMQWGVAVPVIVRRNGDALEVVDGRQRVRAAREANDRLSKQGSDRRVLIGAQIRRDSDVESSQLMVAVNELRVGDDPIVRARKMQRLLNQGVPHPEVARQFGLTVDHVHECLKLLDVHPEVQAMVSSGKIPISAAGVLSKLPREEQQGAMADIQAQGLPVNRTTLAQKVKVREEAKRTGGPEAPVSQAPRKKTIQDVIDAYAADERAASQAIRYALQWMLSGQGARKVPGPRGSETLADFLKAAAAPKPAVKQVKSKPKAKPRSKPASAPSPVPADESA